MSVVKFVTDDRRGIACGFDLGNGPLYGIVEVVVLRGVYMKRELCKNK